NNRINNTLKKQYALGLIGDLKNRIYKSDFIDYIVILRNTDEIKYKKIQLFEIKDMIDVLEIKIQEYEEEGVDVSEALEIFEESLIYFKEENLDKASSLLVETDTKLESKRVKLTVTDIIAQESLSFLKKYWKRLVIIFLVVVIFSYVFYRKLRIFRLKRRLRNLNIEEGVLIEIIKETQNSRFVEQKMSDSVYDIKMEKYNERLNKVKESVKIVKSVLDKLTKKKRKSSNKKKGLEREKKLKKIFAKVKDKQKEDIKKRKKKHSRNLFKELFKKVPRKKEHLKNVKSKKDFKKKIKANKKLKKRLGWLEKRAPKPKFRKKSKGWRKRKLQIKKRIKIKNKKRRSIPSNKLRSKKKKK
ncbi:MAG: hypothetical protein KJ674_05195, partial [Nanoarchaeota archaeon]|nr:hypothetical protein [Nanoarchaeota archaeon]